MKTFSLAASVALGIAAIVAAQPASPKFDVASIRAGCGGGGPAPAGTKSGPPGTKGGGAVAPSSPGRLSICRPLDDELGGLIEQAYGRFANGQRKPPWAVPHVIGGPAWIRSDSYEISARAESNPSIEMMAGPMLQALLEDRFHLKMHRETREVPVYALTIAKNGPKLRPFKEGTCIPTVWTNVGMLGSAPPAPPDKLCRDIISFMKAPNITVELQGSSLDVLAYLIGRTLDRPVIDKTGLKGRFEGTLEFVADSSTIELPVFPPLPGAPTPRDPAPTIFTAIQEQLGLKLEPTKGPQEVLVIDNVERPTEN